MGGGAEAPPLLKLGDGAHLCLKEEKPNKGRRGGVQVSLLLILGHGALEITKIMKKRQVNSLFAKSWQWHFRNNKKKQKKKGSKFPFY
jgi:hypothetical protein